MWGKGGGGGRGRGEEESVNNCSYHLRLWGGRGQKSLGPLKMSLEMAHKVIVPQKKLGPKVS